MNARGFSLFELAIVLVIVASLSVAALAPLHARIEARQRHASAALLDTALEALYGYAQIHGRLPCPDEVADGDGREDRSGTACRVAGGLLPHVDLGVAGVDAWDQRLRYHVTTATPSAAAGASFTAPDDGVCGENDGTLDLCERGTLEVLARGDDPRTVAREGKALFTLADGVPALVLSHGANGHGAVVRGAAARPVPAAHIDEAENADGDLRFVARDYAMGARACADASGDGTPLCGFDDLLRWLSPNVLAARLIRAGRLP